MHEAAQSLCRVLKWSVKMQGTKRQDAMQFFNRAVAAEVMVSIFTMTISFVFLTFFKNSSIEATHHLCRLVHEYLGCPWRSIKQCQGRSLVLGVTPRTFRV